MRSHLRLLTLLILLLPFVFNACSKEDYLPGLIGKMVGQIYTFSEFGELLDDHSQVKITAIGMDESYTVNSDQSGRFELKELPTGTYELHFEKSGFGVLKQFGVQHLGGQPTILPKANSYEYAFFLYEIPTTTITNLSIVDDSLSVYCSFTVPVQLDRVRVQLYYSTSDNFSLSEAEYVEAKNLWNANGYFTSILYFQDAPFDPGETVYVKAGCINEVGIFQPLNNYRTIYGIDNYFDYESNTTIYPGLGHESAQYSFIFPE